MIAIFPPKEYPCPTRKALPKTVTKDSLKRLDLDATITDSSTFEINYSENPIEFGRSLTDHARRLPITITAEVQIPDDPGMYLSVGEQDAVREEKFSSTVYEYLKTLARDYVKLSVLSSDGRFENMVITSIVPTTTIETGNTKQFAISFKEIEFAYSAVTEAYAPENTDTDKQIKNNSKQGNVTKKEVTENTEEYNNDTGIAEQYRNTYNRQVILRQ